MTALQLARFLGAMRQRGRAVPIYAAEALLLIASGIDNVPDLQSAMRDSEGQPLPSATASRLISLLRGRALYRDGAWLESPFSLLDVRRHPHRRGLQIRLSDAGIELFKTHFSAQDLCADHSTCDEQS